MLDLGKVVNRFLIDDGAKSDKQAAEAEKQAIETIAKDLYAMNNTFMSLENCMDVAKQCREDARNYREDLAPACIEMTISDDEQKMAEHRRGFEAYSGADAQPTNKGVLASLRGAYDSFCRIYERRAA